MNLTPRIDAVYTNIYILQSHIHVSECVCAKGQIIAIYVYTYTIYLRYPYAVCLWIEKQINRRKDIKLNYTHIYIYTVAYNIAEGRKYTIYICDEVPPQHSS